MTSLLPGPGSVRMLLTLMIVAEHLSRFRIGGPALMAFFVLSGYWVFRSYDLRYRHMSWSVFTFYMSRFLRIWPLYATVFVATVLLLALVTGRYDPVLWFGLPILGISTHALDRIGICWSLDIILQFYLLVPLIWLVSVRCVSREKWLGAAIAVLVLSALGWGLFFGFGLSQVLAYLPLFLAGMAIYLRDLRVSVWAALLSVATFALVGALALKSPELRPYVVMGSGDAASDKLFAITWVLTLLPFLAWCVHRPDRGLDRLLGSMAYPLFLIHYPMIVLGKALLERDFSTYEKPLLLLAALAVALAVYLFVGRYFEALRRNVIEGMAAWSAAERGL